VKNIYHESKVISEKQYAVVSAFVPTDEESGLPALTRLRVMERQEYVNVPQVRSETWEMMTDYKSEAAVIRRAIEEIVCKWCGHKPLAKAGPGWSGTTRYQMYQCSQCGHRWMNKEEPYLMKFHRDP
jgi:DNA-directed RNA polymerase subunit RPC12/RpoP